MNILISNDDGIDSPGIFALASELKTIANVTVVAPESQMSAMGHALTISKPLRLHPFNRGGELFGYAVNGTPADCVKLAISHVLDIKPDLVVSGINHGRNTAVNILYSGTVSAASEGMLSGVPSIAISHDSHAFDRDMGISAKAARKIVESTFKTGLKQGTLLNVNIPDLPEGHIKGIRPVRQGGSVWEDSFEKRVDPFGHDYYWFSGRYSHVDTDPYSDDQALKDGYITVTPLRFDLTDRELLSELKDYPWE